jgi:hypothetical protein
MLNATFCCPDLDTFCRLDRLGLSVTGQQIHDDHAVLACRVLEADDCCQECGARGVARDTVLRRLAHVPFGWRPTIFPLTMITGSAFAQYDLGIAARRRPRRSPHLGLYPDNGSDDVLHTSAPDPPNQSLPDPRHRPM